MRRNAKVDANQKEIVAAFRELGCTVQSLHRVGEGVPDLLVAQYGQNHLVEVKEHGSKMNKRQMLWEMNWRGRVYVVRNVDEVIALVQNWKFNK